MLRNEICITRNHYPQRAPGLDLDFKDATTTRFRHSDVVLFIETRFFLFNRPPIQFFKTFFLQVSQDQNNLTSCQKYHKFPLSSIFADDRQAARSDVPF